MRQRALIHVGGPAGAGKTAFIEALLAADDEDAIIAVRCRRDESLSKARESRPKNDSELRRYAEAGAIGEVRYAFPDGSHNEFFMAGFMEDFSDAVVIEGDDPVAVADIEVHVAAASQGPLLVRQKRRAGPVPPASEALLALLEQAGGTERVLARLLRDGHIDAVRQMEQHIEIERGRTHGGWQRTKSAAASMMRWTVAEEHSGIERAQLVVVNIRGEDQRERGEALLAEVARLRDDPEVFADMRGLVKGGKVRITAVVAELTNHKDPGTRKALARVRRTIRSIV
jgi:hypothetical protein